MAEAEVKSFVKPPRRLWVPAHGKFVVTLASAVLLAIGLTEVYRVCVGSNSHVVIPGKVYRSAQLSGPDLEALVREHGIRTVVNLRGNCSGFPWYEEEGRATCNLDICQEDINLSAGRLPSVSELRRLIEVLEKAEYPLLIHCRRGADRTGLTASVVRLLLTEDSIPEAQSQLGLRYGHVALGQPAILGDFFTLYTDWLDANQQTHSPKTFRRWVLEEYRARACHGRIELADKNQQAERQGIVARAGRSIAVRVRATNLSTAPWHFQPSVVGGIHFGFFVWDEQDRLVAQEKFGHLRATVLPGSNIEATAVIPGLEKPGRYRLLIDLVEEGHCWFHQAGSEPLEEELRIHE